MNFNETLPHTRQCLAYAIICAVENLRDADGQTDINFRIAMQEGQHLVEADGYLAQRGRDSICRCYVDAAWRVMERWINEDTKSAQDLAKAFMENGTITPQDYLELCKWTEGRNSYFGSVGN